MPLVTIIMNGFNCEKYLKEAIDSVYNQTYDNWEIVFWDNGSTDSTQEIACGYGEKLRYFRSEKNLPLGSARNRALEKAQGVYIAFLDTDDYWLANKLTIQVEFMQNHSNVSFLYSNFYLLNQDTGSLKIGLRRPQPSGNVFGHFLKHYPVNLQTIMLRSKCLNSLDRYFDEKLTLSEEFDFFMRILHDNKAYFMKEITAVYRVHSNMLSIKKIEGFAMENEICLKKFLSIYPSISNEFHDEINIFRKKIIFWKARASMSIGNSVEARKFLSKYLFKDVIFSILFIGTFSQKAWKNLLILNQILK